MLKPKMSLLKLKPYCEERIKKSIEISLLLIVYDVAQSLSSKGTHVPSWMETHNFPIQVGSFSYTKGDIAFLGFGKTKPL